MITLLTIVAVGGWLAFGIIALRMSGIARDRDEADLAREEQAHELREAVTEFREYKEAAEAQKKDLHNEIQFLETLLRERARPGDFRDSLNRLYGVLQTPNPKG